MLFSFLNRFFLNRFSLFFKGLCENEAEVLERLQNEIMNRPVAKTVIEEIAQFLDSLPPHVQSMAVRSSGTEEDEAAASWAGQYETFLNVPRHSVPLVLDAVKKWFNFSLL